MQEFEAAELGDKLLDNRLVKRFCRNKPAVATCCRLWRQDEDDGDPGTAQGDQADALPAGGPSQQGSWSIKKVLPCVAPWLRHESLDGVQDGGMAMDAYRTACDLPTGDEGRATIERQLLAYCRLDTAAMVVVWSKFSGCFPQLLEPLAWNKPDERNLK